MPHDDVQECRDTARRLQAGADAALDLAIDIAREAPGAPLAERLRADAFRVAATFLEGARLVDRYATLLESRGGRERAR